MRRIKMAVAGVALAMGLVAGGSGVAHADYYMQNQGPQITVTNGCANGNCFRWILQNGVVRQGPYANMVGETPLMLVLCSYRPGGPHSWLIDQSPYGPFNNQGSTYPYCLNPGYAGNANPNPGSFPWATHDG